MDIHNRSSSRETLSPEAPEFIRVLPVGFVKSEKGNFLVDNKSFQMMKETMKKRAIDIVIDYEHQTLKDIQAPAGGWIKELVLKDDGIFARVEWTDRARKYLRNKEYKYISPVVIVSKKDLRVSQLHSVALTNTPAINGMTPIINPIDTPCQPEQLGEKEKMICRMLNISEDDYLHYWAGDADG